MKRFKPKSVLFMGAIAVLFGCASPPPLAQSASQTPQIAIAAATPLSDADYSVILRTHVNANGLVNYPALQANPKRLKDFLTQLGAVSPSTYAAWNEQDKMAFLINAYNAITLASIIDQDPLKESIKEIGGVWNRNKHPLLGESKTLDDIEHQILRKQFNEPRIHAALVCAAISCPPLRREPYTGEQLNQQLDDQVRKWLSSAHGLQIDRTHNRVSISSIFKWFGEDWQKTYKIEGKFMGNEKERAILNFISHYVSSQDKTYLEQGNYKLDYLKYDWSLNQQ